VDESQGSAYNAVTLVKVIQPMRDFLRIQAFVFCCLLGGWVGAALSVTTFGTWALERYQVEHPGEYVCGLFALPYLLLGFLPGAVIGGVVGWRVQRRLAARWRQPPPPGPAAG
jgi:hypothetical protein